MRNLCSLQSILLILILSSSCRKDNLYGAVEEYRPPIVSGHLIDFLDNINGYYRALPANYDSLNTNNRYPVIVSFHGAGGFGTTPEDFFYGDNTLFNPLKKAAKFPPSTRVGDASFSFVILSPQFKEYPTNTQIKSFIDYALANFNIDSSRVYLVGTSIGGRMASDYTAYDTLRIAALIALAGCADDNIVEKGRKIASANIPVWLFHNRFDEAWPVSAQTQFYDAINSFNPKPAPILTIFEESAGNLNHDAWTRGTDPNLRFPDQNIYEWMLQFHK